jgi:hypothetical protein
MVTALIATVGLMFCQELYTLDGGLAKIEESPQYIRGDVVLCRQPTVLSPDGSKPLDLRLLTDQSFARSPIDAGVTDGGIAETTLVLPKPIVRQCKATYQVKTSEVAFPKGKTELTKEARAQLAMVMADSPVGLSFVGYVEEHGRNSEETTRLRLQAIRSQIERLAVSAPSVALEERPLSAKRLAQGEPEVIQITAVLANPCGERVLPPRAASTMSRGNDGKGGTAVK